ncbi:hypothetical protein [Candidatus Ichthyocystis hellenicum]|uniref:hypothetical protein n=1 Tax=Candidatus Ichthyocystis hellenicum TaxID=1561003 RepID=UPI000B842FC7|nr:hypothetical protein [Candidatus Ichthyocystis hellenicum]
MEKPSSITGSHDTEEHDYDQKSNTSCEESDSDGKEELASLSSDTSDCTDTSADLTKIRSFLWSHRKLESVVDNYTALPIGKSSLDFESAAEFYEACSPKDEAIEQSKLKRGFLSLSMESLNIEESDESAESDTKPTFLDSTPYEKGKLRKSSSLSNIDDSSFYEEKRPNFSERSLSEIDLKKIEKKTKKYLATALAEAEFFSIPKTTDREDITTKDEEKTATDEVDFQPRDHKKIRLVRTKTKLGSYRKIDVSSWKEEREGTERTDDYLREELLEKTLNARARTKTGEGINKISPLATSKAHSRFSGENIFIHSFKETSLISANLGNIRLPGNKSLEESLRSEFLGLVYLIFNDLKELEKSIPKILSTATKDEACFILDNFIIKSKKVLLTFFDLICDLPEAIFSHSGIIESEKEYERVFIDVLNTKLAKKIEVYKDKPEYHSILNGLRIGLEQKIKTHKDNPKYSRTLEKIKNSDLTDIYSYLFENSRTIIVSILDESRLFLERSSNYKPELISDDALNIRPYLYKLLFNDTFTKFTSTLERRVDKIKNNYHLIQTTNYLVKEELANYSYIGEFYIPKKLVAEMKSCIDMIIESIKYEISDFESAIINKISIGKSTKRDKEICTSDFFEKEILKKHEDNFSQLIDFVRRNLSRITVVTHSGEKTLASIKEKERIVEYFEFLLSRKLNAEYLLSDMIERIRKTEPIVFTASKSLSQELVNRIYKVCERVSDAMDDLISVSIESITDLYLNGSTANLDEVLEEEIASLTDQFYSISKLECHGKYNMKAKETIEKICGLVDYSMSELLECHGNILEKRLERIYLSKTTLLTKLVRKKIPEEWRPTVFKASPELSRLVMICLDNVCKEVLSKFKIVTNDLERRVCDLYVNSDEKDILAILGREIGNCKQLFMEISKQSCRGEANLRAKEILCEIAKVTKSSKEEIFSCYGNLLERRLTNVYKFELANIKHKLKHRESALSPSRRSSVNK